MRSRSTRRIVLIIGIVFTIVVGLFVGQRLRAEDQGISPALDPDSVPYSVWGPYPVGFAPLLGGSDSPVELVAWYPALQVNEDVPGVSYPYEVKFGRPLGTLAVASYEGDASLNASPDPLAGPYPLLILSPGFSIGPTSYAWLAEHLASYGFVVLSPDHDEQLDPDNQLWRAVITRPQDIPALLAYVDERAQAGEGLMGLIDQDTVAVIGHSYGGYTALAAAGARIDTRSVRAHCDGTLKKGEPGAWLCDKLLPHLADMADLAGLDSVPDGLWPAWSDGRVDAIVPMAGNAFFFGQASLSEISVPVMAIGGTADADSPYMWGTYPTYEYASSTAKVRVSLKDADHMIFAGPCETIPWYLRIFSGEFCSDQAWDRAYAHGLIKHFTTAFLLAELKSDAAAAEVLVRTDIELHGVDYEMGGFGEGEAKPQ
jgi:predicted dienelactone hydrolase